MRMEMGGVVRRDGVIGSIMGLVAATVLATFLGVGLLTFAGERLMNLEEGIWNRNGYAPIFSGLTRQ